MAHTNIQVMDLVQTAEANRIANEQALRTKVQQEVSSFLNAWNDEMKASGETEVYKHLPVADAKKLFSSIQVALEILYGMGLRYRRHKEASTGFWRWRKVEPAWIELWYPEKDAQ